MDAIVAAATPVGRAALAIVRVAGRDAFVVLDRVAEPLGPWRDRSPRRARFFDPEGVFDDGVVVRFPGPRSATGDDLVELTVHGNPHVVARLVSACVAAGATPASPGEFTRRALIHGKLDLPAAEAVLQIAEATSDRGLQLARAGVDGRLQAHLQELRQPLIDAAADLEARLDYPADELAYLDDDQLLASLADVAERCEILAETERSGRAAVFGARVALVGAVNAGKSSLFNALLGRQRALVHETPGTTRDVLEVVTRFGDLQVTLLDTAGERVTDDVIEAAGLALARELVDDADLLLVVLRARPEGISAAEQAILDRTADRRRIVVYNGVDASPAPAGALGTVAIRGEGITELQTAIREALVGPSLADTLAIASARQADHLRAAAEAAREAAEALPFAGVAAAADAVVRAILELDALTGADARDDVLNALFARFCIGK